MSGLVREVIVADGGSSDPTLMMADAAGARIVRGERSRGSRLAAGASSARADWFLFLQPETALASGWEAEAEGFIERGSRDRRRAATFRYAVDGFDRDARLKELVARGRTTIFGLPYGDQGLLIPKHFYLTLGGYSMTKMEDVDLIRRIGRRHLVFLRSLAINKVGDEGDGRPGPLFAALHALRVPRGVLSYLAQAR